MYLEVRPSLLVKQIFGLGEWCDMQNKLSVKGGKYAFLCSFYFNVFYFLPGQFTTTNRCYNMANKFAFLPKLNIKHTDQKGAHEHLPILFSFHLTIMSTTKSIWQLVKLFDLLCNFRWQALSWLKHFMVNAYFAFNVKWH